MQVKWLKFWFELHSWTSLISTLLLLVLFATGLPLIFRAEINHALGYGNVDNTKRSEEPLASVDAIAKTGLDAFPGEVIQYVVWESDKPDIVILSMAKTPDGNFFDNHNVVVDAYSAQLINDQPEPLEFFVSLHTHLLTGSTGAAILGFVSLLFLLALISGFVIYAPSMRRRVFGDIRKSSTLRNKWLDFHNMFGMIIMGWALVVGSTGVINSWGEFLYNYWRYDQLAEMVAPYENQDMSSKRVPLEVAINAANQALPDMEPYFLGYPQSLVTSDHHYAVFMRGKTPRTESLMQPVLIDAATGEVTDTREMPSYMQAMYLSQPLHFGDYGGLPLKIIWLVFDIAALILLSSGVYLWVSRRRNKLAFITIGRRSQERTIS